MATDTKLDEILMLNKLGFFFPLGNGEPARCINSRVTPSDLFLRKLPTSKSDGNLKDRWIGGGRDVWEEG